MCRLPNHHARAYHHYRKGIAQHADEQATPPPPASHEDVELRVCKQEGARHVEQDVEERAYIVALGTPAEQHLHHVVHAEEEQCRHYHPPRLLVKAVAVLHKEAGSHCEECKHEHYHHAGILEIFEVEHFFFVSIPHAGDVSAACVLTEHTSCQTRRQQVGSTCGTSVDFM